jgi:hypothetical protein
MSDPSSPPRVFISYSHDSVNHKRWVLDFVTELRTNGVDPIIDAWDLRPGDDVPKFMEHGVRDANRVLMICTELYVAKANDGTGGVGYEAMIVTAELVRDLGTAKFIPIVRQAATPPSLPTSVATRKYINLSESADRASEMQALLRELHSVPHEKPPLGSSPFAVANQQLQDGTVPNLSGAAPTSDDAIHEPAAVYQLALQMAQRGDILRWRSLVTNVRREIGPALQSWGGKYKGQLPPTDPKTYFDTLSDQSMEGVAAFAPLIAIAIAGAVSGQSKFSNQGALLNDILNPSEWDRSGLVVRAELPATGGFVYQALLGSTSLYVSNVQAAIELARRVIIDKATGKPAPLWCHHELIGWPEALGRNSGNAWRVALNLPSRWKWLNKVFPEANEYQAALYAYYVVLCFVEFVERVHAGDLPQTTPNTDWWPNIPAFFEATDIGIKQQGYQLVIDQRTELRSWLSARNVRTDELATMWSTWIKLQNTALASEHKFWRNGLTFAQLVPDLLDH